MSLTSRIENQETTVAVIGIGYVGLPVCIALVKTGFDVVGYDIDEARVKLLRAGGSYVDDVSDAEVTTSLERGFHPTTDPKELGAVPVHVFAVPTDFRNGKPQMGPLEDAVRTVATQRQGRGDTLFVVTSTVYPGATAELVEPTVSEHEFTVGDDALVAIAPERINPGDGKGVEDLPVNIGADDKEARRATATLYRQIASAVHTFDSSETVEIAKIIENGYRLVNISFINEIAKFADEFNADVWDAINAASTKPMGYQPFYPGPGAGGHCIPVDPRFLLWQANNIGSELSVLESAVETNESMPLFVTDRIEATLADAGIDIADAVILALGITYKPDIADVRHSPAREVCTQLVERGADVRVVDPVAEDPSLGRAAFARDLTPKAVAAADLVAVLVDHSAFDMDQVARDASLVFDARDAVPDDESGTVVGLTGTEKTGSAVVENPEN